jgi:hypothetical protein
MPAGPGRRVLRDTDSLQDVVIAHLEVRICPQQLPCTLANSVWPGLVRRELRIEM